MQDALAAARRNDWNEAMEAVHLPVCFAPRNEIVDALALEMIIRLARGGEKKRKLAESGAIIFTRSYGVQFGYDLQASLDRLCNELKQPRLFNVKEILQRFLDESPERKLYDPEIVKFVEGG